MCYSVAHRAELACVYVILWEALGLCDQHWEGACGVKVAGANRCAESTLQQISPEGIGFH